MRNSLVAVLIAFGLSLFPSTARADVAPPIPPPKEVRFKIEVDENAKGSKLVVPSTLTHVRVRPPRPPGKDGKEPLAVLEYEVEDDGAVEPARNRNHLMVAGLALTLAIALGGVWLVRRDGRGRGGVRGLALLIGIGGSLAIGTYVWANAAPMPPPKKQEAVMLPLAFDGKLTLEMVGHGDTIKLVLDKTTYDNIKKEPKKPETK